MDEEPTEGMNLAQILNLDGEDVGALNAWEEDAVMQLLGDFAKPREPRTMGRVPVNVWHMAAIVQTRNRVLRSGVRDRFIETVFFMSRSVGGWGSDQYASVVKTRKSGVNEKLKRFFMGGDAEDGE